MSKYCYLTDVGLKKVEEALERIVQDEEIMPEEKKSKLFHNNGKHFPENVNDSQLARFTNHDSATITKILGRTGGVNENSLEKLFVKLEIITVEGDMKDFKNKYYYERTPEQNSPPEPNNNEPSVKIIVSQNGIPFIVRRNT